ncbi:hypothetical protein, partial [Nitrosomonas sp.]|uniref:hypothetical protein n=1 Tax=Nitrosomonas sp. TaxID=42353 RepID=UPI0035B3E168
MTASIGMRSVFTFILSFVVLLFNGCATTGGSTPKTPPESSESSTPSKSFYTLQGRNYSFAIYNDAHRLLTHPLEDLLAEMKWREMAGQENISDIYIISHGWNYTLSTAVANYHNYVELIDKYMHDQKEKNEKFQPYFIFITWTSSVRPLTNLTKNLLPF